MKTLVYTLLAVGTFATPAFAGTPLVVDTVVTDTDVQGKDKVLGRFHILTEDGQQVVMPVGETRFAVTPTSRDNRHIDLTLIYTHPNDSGKDSKLGPYLLNETLDKSREISFGSVTYSTKVSKSK